MKNSRPKLVNTIQILFFVALVLLTVIILALEVVRSQQAFNLRAETMRADYVAQQKALIKQESERVLKTINYQRSRIEPQTQDIVRQRVYEASAIAQNIFEQNRDKKSADIQKMIVDALRPIRFNQGTGYYFVVRRTDGVSILQPDDPKGEGTVRLDIQDVNGQYIIKDMIALSGQKREGFYEYEWTKPGAEGHSHKKTTFVQRFEPFDWFIGTGLYVEDVEAQVKKELLEQIAAIRFGDNGYFFVSDWQGIALAHGAQPSLVGTDLWEYQDSKGNKTSQSLIALAQQKNGGYVEFWWRKPDTQIERPKIAYSRGVPEWQWMIGTGVYLDDVEVGIAELEKVLGKELFQDIRNTVLVATITLFLFFVIFRMINRRLLSDLFRLTSFFEQAATEDKEIDQQQMRFAELYQVAGNANSMLRDKMAAEQGLRNEKERFEALAEHLPVAVWETDSELSLTYANREALELFGYSPEELATGLDGLKMFTPEDGARFKQNVVERLEDKPLYFDEYQALKSTGETFSAIIHSSPIQRQGEVVGIRGVVVDITERKQAEDELETERFKLSEIIRGTAVGTWEWNVQTGAAKFNDRWAEIIGYTLEELSPVSIETWLKHTHPDDLKESGKLLEKHFKDELEFYEFECRMKHKDGRWIWVIDRGQVSSWTDAGEPLLMFGTHTDIDERKRIEEARQKLEKLNTVGTLAGGLAHDFNNILAGLYGNVSLAKRKLANDHPGFGFLEAAEKSMNRATLLTNQLLTFAKGGAPVKENICLKSLVEEVVHFNLSGSNVKPVITQADNLWLAKADLGQIQQVFGNLTINAKQAMPGGGHLHIAMENADFPEGTGQGPGAGKYVQITVADEGTGISPEILDRIFEPYFTTKQTGSGLGLATIHSIINRHGGQISVTSELGKGTTFTFFLPASESQNLPSAQHEAVLLTRKQSAKILVMDDEEEIRSTLTAMLKELGFTAETAPGGQQAVELYRQAMVAGQRFDLAILDLTIPGGVGGEETAQNILQLDSNAKLLVSSGYADDPIMSKHTEYGFVGVITKPYNMDKLSVALSQALG